MPVPALKSLAKKAKKSLDKVESFWKDALASAKKSDADNVYAYAMGIVKKRLGLESVDLALCGVDSTLLLHESDVSSGFCDGPFDYVMCSIALSELSRKQSDWVDKGVFTSELVEAISSATESYSLDDLRKLFPNVSDDYLKVLLTESTNVVWTLDQLRKLFPNVQDTYLKVLLGESFDDLGIDLGDEEEEEEEEGFDEPTEDDYIMTNTGPLGSRTSVSQYRKHLGVYRDEEEAEKFIRGHAKERDWFPGVWFLSDHGNTHRREFNYDEAVERTEKTEWEVWTYDVWGNSRDGWDVNDRSCVERHLILDIPKETYYEGRSGESVGASPTDDQILDVLGGEDNKQGDDTHIYVDDEDGKPIGEMICVSHESLSPIRIIKGFKFSEAVERYPYGSPRNKELNEYGVEFQPDKRYQVLDRSNTTCTLYAGNLNDGIDVRQLITIPQCAVLFEKKECRVKESHGATMLSRQEAKQILEPYVDKDISEVYDDYEVSEAIFTLNPGFVFSEWSGRTVDQFLRAVGVRSNGW